MNTNIAPRSCLSPGTSKANACATAARRETLTGDDGRPLLTPEEHRQLKLMEALNERAKIDRLRKEANERLAEERRMKF